MRKVPATRIAILIALASLLMLFISSCSLIPTTVKYPADEDLASVVARYLDGHIFEPSFGGQVFCATEMLHLDQQGTAIKAYVWAFCIEYFEEGPSLQMGTAVSEPLLVYMIEHEGRTLASGYAEPRDGTLYAEDIKRMFPDEAVSRMCLGDISCSNDRTQRLQTGVDKRMRQIYNLPIATQPWE